jgi:hypothetical protein
VDNAVLPCDNVDENFILQRFCSMNRQAAGVVCSCVVPKRVKCGLSVAHDELANRFYAQRLKPATTSVSKSPLLLSTVAQAGFTHIDINSETGEFQTFVILAVPVVNGAGAKHAVHVFFIVFDSSDKYVKIFSAPPLSIYVLVNVIDPASDVASRKAQVKQYAMDVLFPQSEEWCSAMTTRRRSVRELTAGGKTASNWQLVKQCADQQLFGAFVEGCANIVDLFEDLLKPVHVTAAMLYEGVLQWAGAFHSIWGVDFGQSDEALWAFIKTKEDQLQQMAGKYAVAEAGFSRIAKKLSSIESERLLRSEQLLDLTVFSDSSPVDMLELARGRKQSLSQIAEAEGLCSAAKRLKPSSGSVVTCSQ